MSVSAPLGDTMPGAGRGSGGGLTHIAEALRPLAVPVVDLVLDPANARKHPERNLDAIAASLRRFGQRKPVVVQKAGMIVRAGNGTVTAARSLGWSHVAAVVVDEASVDATAFAIADNRTAELAEWDEPVLAGLLDSLPDEALPDTGFTEDDLRKLIASVEDRQITEDDAPEPLPDPVSRMGDLWVMGEHRLLCGDSTKPEDVTLCLGGAKPFIMVTDPPYGVEYDPEWRKDAAEKGLIGFGAKRLGVVANDDRADWTEAWTLFPGDVAYVWHGSTRAIEVGTDLLKAGFQIRSSIIWKKPLFAISRGHYHWQHEPCWYAVRKGRTSKWCGDRSQSTVWDVQTINMSGANPDDAQTNHGTQKPVEIMARPIRNHGGKDDDVYEPFSGSGTTIIAAEQLGRKCYAIEIEPRYVDVGVRRWQKLTGKAATLNGKTFAEVAAERGVTLPNE